MTKFHINKHGVPAQCNAKEGNCPLGGNDTHFKNKELAQAYIDSQLESEHGLLCGLSEDLNNQSLIESSDSLTEEEKKFVNKEIIFQYDLHDYIDDDGTEQEKLEQIARFLGDDTVIKEIAEIKMKNQIDEVRIDSIEARFQDLIERANAHTKNVLDEMEAFLDSFDNEDN